METLILTECLGSPRFNLHDVNNAHLAWFHEESAAANWCRDNGYRMCVERRVKTFGRDSLRDLRAYDKRNPGKTAEEY